MVHASTHGIHETRRHQPSHFRTPDSPLVILQYAKARNAGQSHRRIRSRQPRAKPGSTSDHDAEERCRIHGDLSQLANVTALSIASVPNLSFDISFQPFSQTITAHGTLNGGNALRLDASDGDPANIDITIYWSDAGSDDAIYATTEKLLEEGERKAKEAGGWNEYLYLTYATKWQKPIQWYGQPNVDMIRRVSRKYGHHSCSRSGFREDSSFPSKGRMKSSVKWETC